MTEQPLINAGYVGVQVKPDSSVAQRSAASGKLVLLMPKEDPQQAVVDVAYLRSGVCRAHTACAPVEHCMAAVA
jgi:hypothetical protein